MVRHIVPGEGLYVGLFHLAQLLIWGDGLLLCRLGGYISIQICLSQLSQAGALGGPHTGAVVLQQLEPVGAQAAYAAEGNPISQIIHDLMNISIQRN